MAKRKIIKPYEGKTTEEQMRYQRYLSYSFPKVAESGMAYAKKLKQTRTPWEVQLAELLFLEMITFKEQFLILNNQGKFYIADFYIPSKNLVIELDGKEFHSTIEGKEKDLKRDLNLQELGFSRIIRIDYKTFKALYSKGMLVSWLLNTSYN
jgi:very-short-patch-repair endonuclease